MNSEGILSRRNWLQVIALNNEDNNSHDPTLLNDIINPCLLLFVLITRPPGGSKLHAAQDLTKSLDVKLSKLAARITQNTEDGRHWI